MSTASVGIRASKPAGGPPPGLWPPPIDMAPPPGIPAGVYNVSGEDYWVPGYRDENVCGPFVFDSGAGLWRVNTSDGDTDQCPFQGFPNAVLNSATNWPANLTGLWRLYVYVYDEFDDRGCGGVFPAANMVMSSYSAGFYPLGTEVQQIIGGTGQLYFFANYDDFFPCEGLCKNEDDVETYIENDYGLGAPNLSLGIQPDVWAEQILRFYIALEQVVP